MKQTSGGLLTFEQAAAELGWTGAGRARRLKRACFARETESGRRFVTRFRNSRRTSYRVTLGAIRRAFPELFRSKVDALQQNLKAYLAGMDAHIAERTAAHVSEHVEPRLQELWDRDEVLADQVQELAERLVSFAKAPKSRASSRPPKTT